MIRSDHTGTILHEYDAYLTEIDNPENKCGMLGMFLPEYIMNKNMAERASETRNDSAINVG